MIQKKIEKKKIVNLYLENTSRINNWDLIDSSADKILGAYLFEFDTTDILFSMATMGSLWEKRIAVVATWYHIRKDCFDPTFDLAKIFLDHPHHLIQKAVGWMLREVGKRSESRLFEFLKLHYCKMGRTMLRYAIEKFPKKKRDKFWKGGI